MNYLPICVKSEYVPILLEILMWQTWQTIQAICNTFGKSLNNTYKLSLQTFNFQMSQKGFQLEYLIVDRNPIGFGYALRMKYKEVIVQQWDYLIPSMDTKQEIVTNIKEMLRNIQTIAH